MRLASLFGPWHVRALRTFDQCHPLLPPRSPGGFVPPGQAKAGWSGVPSGHVCRMQGGTPLSSWTATDRFLPGFAPSAPWTSHQRHYAWAGRGMAGAPEGTLHVLGRDSRDTGDRHRHETGDKRLGQPRADHVGSSRAFRGAFAHSWSKPPPWSNRCCYVAFTALELVRFARVAHDTAGDARRRD